MKKGGKRIGAGRPAGSPNKSTIEKKIIEAEMHARVLRSSQALLNSQMTLAQGVQMLYRIRTDKKGNRGRPEIVTQQLIIEAYLAGELDDEEDEYYFITTERPDNRALDSLFDRVLGKATQRIDLDPEDKGGFELTITRYTNPKKKKCQK